MTILQQAAVYFLKHQGQRGTPKQVDKLIKLVGPAVIRMASERGWVL
jgi:hypothetical protein